MARKDNLRRNRAAEKKKLEKTKTVQSQKIFKGETPSKTSMEKHYNNETQKS
jgi:hypothetical protein